ncbi:type II secretion system secretin GspD [Luteimonas deserti]|uniref:Type II secretion system secretin GspD n=1 Tax=Luteimonas deserti TaxID=2752306 RepID=A0A7Z0QS82_9GAMM|nr:type II secretion system secretin GspD [Luteimonas deserti]NYZ63911.1 type II secretion system secretin GspD [Luteimonas deserti]
MTRRAPPRLLLACALALACPLHPLSAQTQTDAPALRMQNVELTAFIQDVARATSTTFIVDPRVQGTVNISRDRPMTDEDLIGVLLTVLRSNGLIAVPAGTATYRVVPDDVAAQQPGSPLGYATSVFPLQRMDARAAAETLKPLVGRGGVVMALPHGNSLLVADYVDNLRRIRGLVSQIDQDSASIDTVSLRNTSARELAATLVDLYGISGANDGALSVLPVESSNSLVVRGNPTTVQRVSRMAMELDARAERSSDVAVVKLQHASAEQLLPVLQQLIGQTPEASSPGAAPAGAAATATGDAETLQIISPAGGKRPVIVRYPGSNSLVIHADPSTQRTLLDVIRQLDVRREQVLVEALVVEVSDEAAKRLGAQLILAGRDGNPIGVTQFASAEPGIVPLAGGALAQRWQNRNPDSSDSVVDAARQAAAQSLLGLSGGLLGIGGGGDNGLFGIIINAVKSDNASSLLSTPSILTLDNEEAYILVGQEVPITTGEVLSGNNDNPFRTIDRKDVGIRLAVKPQINAGGGVTLHIKQEVSSVNGTVSSRSDELVLNKREIENRVVVDDGAIIAIGGLLDQSSSLRADRVPLLGDVPVLGALFRSNARLQSKTNLMVFLRPTVIRNAGDAQRHTAQRYGYLRDTGLRGDPAALVELDALVRDYLRADAPVVPPQTAPVAEPVNPVPGS